MTFLQNVTFRSLSLDAEVRESWTRNATGDAAFEATATAYKDGVLTVTVKGKDQRCYAVSLNIRSNKEKEDNTAATNVNSDYVAVIQGSYYVKNAYLTVANQLDGKLVYNQNTPIDFSAVGKLNVSYTATASETQTSVMTDAEMESLNVASLFTYEYTLDGTGKDYFNVATGKVSLKSEYVNIVDLLGKEAAVYGKVVSEYVLTADGSHANPIQLGKVEIVRTTAPLAYTYTNLQDVDWSNSEKTIALDAKEVYQNSNVNISASEYASLIVESAPTSNTAPYITVDHNNYNALTLIIPAGIAEKEYTPTVVLKKTGAGGDEYKLTISAKVNVVYPEVKTLEFADVFYKDGMVYPSFSFEGGEDKPSGITEEYNLNTLFANISDVESSLQGKNDTTRGGSITISIANKDKFDGVDFDSSTGMLTIDKDLYGLKAGEPAQNLQLKAEVKLADNLIQTLVADIYIKDLSGSWKAGNLAVTLSDKAATVELAKTCGLVWNDVRGFAMWKNGKAVKGSDENSHFATSVTDALDLYGLDAPTFAIVAVNGEKVSTSDYITVTTDGKVSFKQAGKDYEFVNPYTVTVKVTAKSQWGTIEGYSDATSTITLTVPAVVK